MNPHETNRTNRPQFGLLIGACVGLVALLVFALSLVTDQHSLNLMPKMEVVGLAFGLVPSSAWAGRQISKGIGAQNRDALLALLKGSSGIGALSVLGLTIGSKVGMRMVGTAMGFDWGVEIGLTLLFFLAAFIAALIAGFLLSWPVHIWLRRKQVAP